jgi:integrase/recombinase XerD
MPRKNYSRIKKKDDGIAVIDAVNDYLESQHVQNLSLRTQEEYRDELQTFASWCQSHQIRNEKGKREAIKGDGVLIHQVGAHAVRLFLDDFQATHKPSKKGQSEISTYTLAGYVRVIKSFLTWCLHDDQYGVDIKVIQQIEKPRVVEKIVETFSPDQIGALFKACEKEENDHLQLRDRAILAVLLDCGLRAEELITLIIGNVHVDPGDSYLKVFGKGSKWREVGMGIDTRKYVQKYIRVYREPTIEYAVKQQYKNLSERQQKQKSKEITQELCVFVGRTGDNLTTNGLFQIIRRLGEWAHIEGVRCSPHTFRHTFSRMFMENDGNIYTLSKLLGHTSVGTTETYLKSLQKSSARKGAKSVLDNIDHLQK